jgi:hypothetical protein
MPGGHAGVYRLQVGVLILRQLLTFNLSGDCSKRRDA